MPLLFLLQRISHVSSPHESFCKGFPQSCSSVVPLACSTLHSTWLKICFNWVNQWNMFWILTTSIWLHMFLPISTITMSFVTNQLVRTRIRKGRILICSLGKVMCGTPWSFLPLCMLECLGTTLSGVAVLFACSTIFPAYGRGIFSGWSQSPLKVALSKFPEDERHSRMESATQEAERQRQLALSARKCGSGGHYRWVDSKCQHLGQRGINLICLLPPHLLPFCHSTSPLKLCITCGSFQGFRLQLKILGRTVCVHPEGTKCWWYWSISWRNI